MPNQGPMSLMQLARQQTPQQVEQFFNSMVESGQMTQQQLDGMYSQAEQMCKAMGLI